MTAIECAASGVIVKDPTIRDTKTGKPWASLTLRIGDGDTAQWLRCSIFGEHVSDVAQLKSGAALYIEGKIRSDSYQTHDGTQRHGLSASCFVARPLGMIGQKRLKSERKTAPSAAKQHYARPSHLTSEPRQSSGPDAEIPF